MGCGGWQAEHMRAIAAVQRLTSQRNLCALPPCISTSSHGRRAPHLCWAVQGISREVSTSRYLSAAHQGSCCTALRYLNLIKSASSAYAASASKVSIIHFSGQMHPWPACRTSLLGQVVGLCACPPSATRQSTAAKSAHRWGGHQRMGCALLPVQQRIHLARLQLHLTHRLIPPRSRPLAAARQKFAQVVRHATAANDEHALRAQALQGLARARTACASAPTGSATCTTGTSACGNRCISGTHAP